MKKYFSDTIIGRWKAFTRKNKKEETCGLFVETPRGNVLFIPMKNIAEDTKENFEIDPVEFYKIGKVKKIKAVLHSHIDFPHASRKDMEKQMEMGIPWGIVNIDKGAVRDPFFFGDQLPLQDLIGRPFIHGVYDCYATVRDFYRVCGIPIKQYPRAYKWWDDPGPNLLTANYADTGFSRVAERDIQPGDVIFMNIGSKQVNHAAVYLGENLILHHLINRLSRRDPFTIYRQRSTFIVRHEDAKKNTLIWELSGKLRSGIHI